MARTRIDRERIIEGAIEVADDVGVADLTIRRLADHLGSKPMTLYHHVSNKDEILDLMVDAVYAEIGPVPVDTDWRSATRERCTRMRDVLRAHPWAVTQLVARRAPGPATLAHLDGTLGCLYADGFDDDGVSRSVALVDAYVFGFAVQEASLPATGGDEMDELAGSIELPPETYPYLARFTADHVLAGGYDFSALFEVGLDLVLDAVEQRFRGARPEAGSPARSTT